MHASSRAFSLVELSIVLVILGLLTGGILAGKSLIRASEVRNVTTEYQRYVAAGNAFREKYFYLPGDLPNATSFWGNVFPSNCFSVPQTSGAATCDGNGNGTYYDTGNGEQYLFWKHLQNAGMIEGSLAGTGAVAASQTSPYTNYPTAKPGWNLPASKLNSGYWTADNFGGGNVALQKFYGSYLTDARPYYGSALQLIDGTKDPFSGIGGSLTPTEMWGIDTKLDDGKPGSGKVEALRGGNSSSAGPCLTNADPALAAYLLTSDDRACVGVFVRAFN